MSDDHLPNLTHAKTWLEEIRIDLLAARASDVLEGAGDQLDDDLLPERIAEARRLVDMLDKHAATLEDIVARAKITAAPAVALRVREITNGDELSDVIANFGDMGSAWVLEDEDGDDKAYMYGRAGRRSLQGLL